MGSERKHSHRSERRNVQGKKASMHTGRKKNGAHYDMRSGIVMYVVRSTWQSLCHVLPPGRFLIRSRSSLTSPGKEGKRVKNKGSKREELETEEEEVEL